VFSVYPVLEHDLALVRLRMNPDRKTVLKAHGLSERKAPLPRHIAVIMDGNGRWARQRGLPRIAGHRAGVTSIRETVRLCGELGVETLTLYAFSTENWRRPPREVSLLMALLKHYLRREVPELARNNVRLATIGRTRDLPKDARKELERSIGALKDRTGLTLVLALSYSGRADLTDAVRRIASRVKAGKLAPRAIDEKTVTGALSTAALPEVDLLIRTSGEMRLSNFLLWELAYSEMVVTKTLWPDFRKKHLLAAIREYQKRERRFGGLVNLNQSGRGGSRP
jgi:undecaprenyl diphosphate synthase